MRRFYLLSLGCAKNAVDAEGIRVALGERGLLETEDPQEADLLIVNSCGFIKAAKEETIAAVFELAGLKEDDPRKRLVLTGCFSQRYPAEVANEMPEVDAVFGTEAAGPLLRHLGEQGVFVEKPQAVFDPRIGHAPAGESGTAGAAAFLKIAEGCDNRCAYCAIPAIRGPFRTRPAAAIIEEAQRLVEERGVLELNLVSQDSSRWCDPHDAAHDLVWLLDRLERISGLEWLRVLYLHPAHLEDALLERLLGGGKVLPYFDLPVQHLVDHLLERMGRRTSYSRIQSLVRRIREAPVTSAIRTTLILGFPGEKEEDVALVAERLRELQFDKLGCFAYSEEDGTAAAAFRPRVGTRVAAERCARIMGLQQEISGARLARLVGMVLPVLVESEIDAAAGIFLGRSVFDAPDVDGNVVISAGAVRPAVGRIVQVRISGAEEYDLTGTSV